MKKISKLAELRRLMMSMERSLGLQDLSAVERDIYYAANDLSAQNSEIKTNGLIEHDLLEHVSRPTFFRALKSLVNKGYLSQSHTVNRGRYTVNEPKL